MNESGSRDMRGTAVTCTGAGDLEPLKDAYWAIITECLVRFHDFDPADAGAATLRLRQVIEAPTEEDDPPPGYISELFYHNEPFHIACDIAGRELDSAEHWTEYDAIARRHYAPVEARLWPEASAAGR